MGSVSLGCDLCSVNSSLNVTQDSKGLPIILTDSAANVDQKRKKHSKHETRDVLASARMKNIIQEGKCYLRQRKVISTWVGKPYIFRIILECVLSSSKGLPKMTILVDLR